MPTEAELVTRIREALSVDTSYEAAIIPFGLRRCGKRLLRDYHFPWATRTEVFTGLVAGAHVYDLPAAGFKKELRVQFFDDQENSWSAPLTKRDGPVLPGWDGVPRHYWIAGDKLTTDITLDSQNAPTTELHVWYESDDWESNKDWMLERIEDALFTFTTFKIAAEKSKKELAEVYAALWADDRLSLAKYLNEVEFDNSEFLMRAPAQSPSERYPIS